MESLSINIPSPKKSKKNLKGTPPTRTETPKNLESPPTTEIRDLNFKVSSSFKKEFQQLALDEGKKGKELLMAMFYFYKNKDKA